MTYLCLRDCFVNDVLWRDGETYELPDEMIKSPKNFRAIKPVEIPMKIEPVKIAVNKRTRKTRKKGGK